MAHNQPQRLRISAQHFRCARRSILMAEAVKAEASNALLDPCIGPRVNVRSGLQCGMESGIKTCNLWNGSAQDMVDRLDRFQLEPVVGGGKLNLLSNRVTDIGCQRGTLAKLGSTMYNAMAHHIDIGLTLNHLRPPLPH